MTTPVALGVAGGTGSGSWILTTSDTYTIDSVNKTLTFDNNNASGSLTLDDGSQVNFSNIEEIDWS